MHQNILPYIVIEVKSTENRPMCCLVFDGRFIGYPVLYDHISSLRLLFPLLHVIDHKVTIESLVFFKY